MSEKPEITNGDCFAAFIAGFVIGAIVLAIMGFSLASSVARSTRLYDWHQAVERGYGSLTVDKEGEPVFTWKEPEPTP